LGSERRDGAPAYVQSRAESSTLGWRVLVFFLSLLHVPELYIRDAELSDSACTMNVHAISFFFFDFSLLLDFTTTKVEEI
jgi:hypothetical protein